MQVGSVAYLPLTGCMCVCVHVHAPSSPPSSAELFENLHMQKALIPGAFPQLRGVLPLAEISQGTPNHLGAKH